jgi:hypothetical protein
MALNKPHAVRSGRNKELPKLLKENRACGKSMSAAPFNKRG